MPIQSDTIKLLVTTLQSVANIHHHSMGHVGLFADCQQPHCKAVKTVINSNQVQTALKTGKTVHEYKEPGE